MNPPIPTRETDYIPIYVSGKGKLLTYFVLNPNSRKRLPAGSRFHCYAISLEAAKRIAAIFNEDQSLAFARPQKSVRAPRADWAPSHSGKGIETP